MKKNRMMRLASVLLVLCLLTTSVIGGTFAKYTSTASGSSTARVAKWGFATTTLTVDMFAQEYTTTPENNKVTVQSDDYVVAPGTTKEATIVLIPDTQTGKPEVAYTFDVNVSAKEGTSSDLLGKLVWSFNGEKCGESGSFEELQEKINETYDKEYEVGTLPTDQFTVTWKWLIGDTEEDNTSDTELGNKGTDCMEIVFDFTATQVD